MDRRNFLITGASLVAQAGLVDAISSDSKMTVAIMGHTGRGNFGHGFDTLWSAFPGITVAGVSDPDPKGLEAVRSKLPGAKAFSDYHEMLDRLRPDLACIAPRHIDQHRDMALAACKAGVKGIYMEKPFCRTLKEADEILNACEKSGTKIALAHRNRYHPALPVTQDLIKSGEIGKAIQISARGKEDSRGGALDLWVLGSHVLNLVPLFTGKFVACSAALYQNNIPVRKRDLTFGDEGVGKIGGNSLHARFETETGIPVYFDSVKDAGFPDGSFGLRIIGSKATISICLDREAMVQIRYGNPFYPDKEERGWLPVSSAGIDKPEPITTLAKDLGEHLAPVRDLLDSVRNNKQPLCSGLDGKDTIEAITSIFESHRLGGQRVIFPLKTRINPLDLLE